HRLGMDKYAGLGRRYEMEGIQPLSDDKIQLLFNAARQSGLDCKIGG
ncbi:MAG: glycyl-radical enzyme activating protein, partial [bacterium]|nr:glycyl-radical enzyme activating protein [bacterium]